MFPNYLLHVCTRARAGLRQLLCTTGISTKYTIHVHMLVLLQEHILCLFLQRAMTKKNEMLLKFQISGRRIMKQS